MVQFWAYIIFKLLEIISNLIYDSLLFYKKKKRMWVQEEELEFMWNIFHIFNFVKSKSFYSNSNSFWYYPRNWFSSVRWIVAVNLKAFGQIIPLGTIKHFFVKCEPSFSNVTLNEIARAIWLFARNNPI